MLLDAIEADSSANRHCVLWMAYQSAEFFGFSPVLQRSTPLGLVRLGNFVDPGDFGNQRPN